jgi:hypothetical protein
MAYFSRPASATVMADYRAFTIGTDGHFNGFEPMVCADDAEAIAKATRLAIQFPVELWSGIRVVLRLPGPKEDSVTTTTKAG